MQNEFNLMCIKQFQAMVMHGRVELLAHPLSQKYLQMKWNSYGKYFHLANVTFYSFFLAFITCFSAQLMQQQKNNGGVNITSNMTHAVSSLTTFKNIYYLRSDLMRACKRKK